MMEIRRMTDEDFETTRSWWSERCLQAPTKSFMPPTSFMLLISGIPLASAVLYLMNSCEAAMVEHVVGNPSHPEMRSEAMPHLIRYLREQAKNWGYKRLVLFSYVDKVKDRYEELGFTKTLENVTTFSMEV